MNQVNRGHLRSREVNGYVSRQEITSSSIYLCSLCSNEYQFQQGRLKIVLHGFSLGASFSLDARILTSDWLN